MPDGSGVMTSLSDLFGGTAQEKAVLQRLDIIINLLKQIIEKESNDGKEENSKGFRSSNKN